MTTPKNIRFPDDLAAEGAAAARAQGVSFNALVVTAVEREIERAKADPDFRKLAQRLADKDSEILQRLAGQ